jgi:YidC/Oxa1 family membrane protein insertase
MSLFNKILYQPLFNALILLYQYLPGHDFGIAVIFLTILIRLILYPLMARSIHSQKALSDLQSKIQEIQKKHKDDKEEQAKEIMSLYQKEKINPFAGFLLILIQLPILIALYQLFWKGLRTEEMTNLYSFVPRPGIINPTFLGIINLAHPNFLFAILAGLAQFFQTKMVFPQNKKKEQTDQISQMIQKQTLYFFPIFTFLILLKLPAAISLYWLATSLFSILQQHLVFKKI